MFKGFFKNPDYSMLEKENAFSNKDILEIFNFINSKLHYDQNVGNKFERDASEIVESGSYNGCSDYATVFEALSRELGIPTVHLLAAQSEWIKELNTGEFNSYMGHHFCECFISGKWMLVDPLNNTIEENYDKSNFNISTKRGTKYYVYAKCNDIFQIEDSLPKEKNGLRAHNKLMKELFTDFDLDKLKSTPNIDDNLTI